MIKIFLPALVCLMMLSVTASAGVYYFDDGLSHTFDDNTYQNDAVVLDYYRDTEPWTSADLVDGGSIEWFWAYNYSTVNVTGGSVGDELIGYENTTITMSGGSVYELGASDNCTITMNGGSVGYVLIATGNTTATMSGGSIGSYLVAYRNAEIYLEGSGFQVDGTPLGFGDKLSDYAYFNSASNRYEGTIIGTLADESVLNNIFYISNTGPLEGTGDIIIIPEPATIFILGFGAITLLRKKRP
ncbi:MAG: PEP-CTERM sorting domain-containing protein [Planctomycetota bacterium]|jgi:hypothetical protein